MKRSKSDVINATVESYLKRRHYQGSDMYRKSIQGNCQTSDEATFNATAECGTSRDNSIVFSAISIDVAAADQAYQRLKAWINIVINDRLKMELKGLLYPLFCHLYLEMLHSGNRQAAMQFLKSHQNEFSSDTEKYFLDELSNIFSVQDIELKPLVTAFRTRKYKVDMSDAAHTCLQQYLTKYGHIILMQIINTHVTIMKKMDGSIIDMDVNEIQLHAYESGINGYVEQPSGTGVDREMRELQEAVRLIRNNTHQPLRIFKVNNAVENASCGRINSKMSKLAVGFHAGEIRLWGISDAVLVKPRCKHLLPRSSFEFTHQNVFDEENFSLKDNVTEEAGAIILRGHKDIIHALRFFSESNILLSVSSDNDMRAWRLNDYSCAAVYSGHSYPVWCMDTSAFNLYIATGSHDRTAKLWSIDRTFPLRIFAGHFLDVNCIKFHPNARYLATGSADKTIRLWDKDEGNLLRVYVGARSTIFSLAFSPDGKYLAAAGDDNSISVWDLSNDALLTELKSHEATVMDLEWSSDGQYLASASLDGIIRLWSINRHINVSNEESPTEVESPRVFATNCETILSLQYFKNNSLVSIAVTKDS